MKAGVIAPEAGVTVNAKDGGEDLGDKKQEEGDIKGSFFDFNSALENHFDKPGRDDNHG